MPNTAAAPAVQGKLTRDLPERRFRPELHGVRGMAILGVVLFHLFGNGRVSGGIDIFLTISGFLFCAMVLREVAESGGRFRPGRYLARLARRLVLPAALVIAVTAAAGWFLLPATQHEQLFREARSSLLYFENWELISSQLAYEAAGADTSPFQHFWSLSVQGQFYLVWPLLVLLAVWIAKALGVSAVRTTVVLVTALLGLSLAYAIHMQGIDQQQAYFMTETRLWEFGFGALLALVGVRIVLPRGLRFVTGWLGIGLIVSTGFVLDGAQQFPGPLALWPMVGLALVLISAGSRQTEDESTFSAARVLSTRPFAWVGDLAYGLYLWHWPLLIFYLEVRDYPAIGVRGAAAVFLVALALAWMTHRWVEQPVARFSPGAVKTPLLWGVSTLGIGAAVFSLVLSSTHTPLPEGYSMTDMDPDDYPGAAVTTADGPETPEGVDYHPQPEAVAQDQPMYVGWGCMQDFSNEPGTGEVLVCEDPEAPEDPEATLMLAGGSHAGMWQHAFALLARENNWELLIADKSGCRFGVVSEPETDTCHEWRAGFPEVVEERQPDVVITPGTLSQPAGSDERIAPDAEERWNEILDAGSELLLLRGTSRPEERVGDCLAEGGSPAECGPDYGVYAETNPLEEMDLPEGIHTVDMLDHICPEGSCPAVIGNVVVYRDASHLTNSYVETLAPILDEKLREEMPHLYR